MSHPLYSALRLMGDLIEDRTGVRWGREGKARTFLLLDDAVHPIEKKEIPRCVSMMDMVMSSRRFERRQKKRLINSFAFFHSRD